MVSSEKTRVVATMNVSDRVINAEKHGCIMRCMLAGVSDLVSADARYHLKCDIQCMRKADCEKKALTLKLCVCIKLHMKSPSER